MMDTAQAPPIAAILNLIATLILVGITAWYARSTARMLDQVRGQARLLTLSVAASVGSGIMQSPPPGELSVAHEAAYKNLATLQKAIGPLLKEIDSQLGLYPHR